MVKTELNNATNFDQQRLIDRGMDEFIGLCKGIIFDGTVCQTEAENLLMWLRANPLIAQQFPAKDVYETLCDMLADSVFDYDEEGVFLDLLMRVTGLPRGLDQGSNASTQLPLCDPAPVIVFADKVFVLTGNFAMGPRKLVVDAIQQRGGEVVLSSLRKDTNYLVIGNIGSAAWIHSTHGRKIEKAVELRDRQNTGLAIVSERHFMSHL